MKKLTISRKRWIRGDEENSVLHREDDNKMCCIGIYLHACKVPLYDLTNMFYPRELHYIPPQAEWLRNRGTYARWVDSEIATELIAINDDVDLKWNTREKKLKEVFYRLNVDVTFVP